MGLKFNVLCTEWMLCKWSVVIICMGVVGVDVDSSVDVDI